MSIVYCVLYIVYCESKSVPVACNGVHYEG